MTSPLHAAMVSLRTFHRDLHVLLTTADGLMDEAGFPVHPSCGNTVLSGGSASLREPDKWAAEYLGRWYQVPDREDLAGYLAVLLLPHRVGHDAPPHTEPLIAVGVAHATSAIPTRGLPYHHARALWHTPIPRDGTTWGTHAPDTSKHPIHRIDSMGLPLTRVPDSDALRNRIIQPLVEALHAAATPLARGT